MVRCKSGATFSRLLTAHSPPIFPWDHRKLLSRQRLNKETNRMNLCILLSYLETRSFRSFMYSLPTQQARLCAPCGEIVDVDR